MKSLTRKARIKQRGRPRDESCERESNGRKHRGLRPRQAEPDARLVATEARVRVLGVAPAIASHEKGGTVLGRLWLEGRISEPLKEAGDRLEERHAANMRAFQVPDSLSAGSFGGSEASDSYVAWANQAMDAWSEACKWLKSQGALAVFERTVIGRNYPDILDFTLLRRGLVYCALQMGIDNAPRPFNK